MLVRYPELVGEPLYRAPLNALGKPPGASGKGYFGRRLVIARFEWPSYTELVPAVVLWRESGRVCVEWEPHPGTPKRHTWLDEDDIRPTIRFTP